MPSGKRFAKPLALQKGILLNRKNPE
jgi:hypothetical protein